MRRRERPPAQATSSWTVSFGARSAVSKVDCVTADAPGNTFVKPVFLQEDTHAPHDHDAWPHLDAFAARVFDAAPRAIERDPRTGGNSRAGSRGPLGRQAGS